MIANKYYLGSQVLSRVYKGSDLIWQSIPSDYILRLDFNNNIVDTSSYAFTLDRVGTISYPTGRKTGTKCARFTSTQLNTIQNVSFGGQKATISYWIKTTQTSVGLTFELSGDTNYNTGAFFGALNEIAAGAFGSTFKSAGGLQTGNYIQHYTNTNTPVNNGVWRHILVEIDTSLPSPDMQRIYVDNVLVSVRNGTYTGSYSGNIIVAQVFIGSRNGRVVPFNGDMQDFRAYNRILSASERLSLYTE